MKKIKRKIKRSSRSKTRAKKQAIKPADQLEKERVSDPPVESSSSPLDIIQQMNQAEERAINSSIETVEDLPDELTELDVNENSAGEGAHAQAVWDDEGGAASDTTGTTLNLPEKKISVEEMMNFEGRIDLETALDATDNDDEYFKTPKPVEYPEDGEHFDALKETGYWGGYHVYGGDLLDASRKRKSETKESADDKDVEIDQHLGQKTSYPKEYNPELLVREPRQRNRSTVNIKNDNLPFEGYDIWNAYEISCLTASGMPVVGFARIVYSCDNEYIVESKSLKLYLNSFNMMRCGPTPTDALAMVAEHIMKDLGVLLETDVKVSVHNASDEEYREWSSGAPRNLPKLFTADIAGMITLENSVSPNLKFETYQESPELLEIDDDAGVGRLAQYHSSLLKSNCKVTHQPDWGDVFILMESKKYPTPESLLKYIVSFRDENHFHEEICETIYKRLHDTFSPTILSVVCLYVRRGGIDINPVRSSSKGIYAGPSISDQGELMRLPGTYAQTIRQ